MDGLELRRWRENRGYTQEALMQEFEVRSRQTISTWEKAGTNVPRLVELAKIALDQVPECRRILGKKATAKERRVHAMKSVKQDD